MYYADRDYVCQKIILCPKNDTSDLIIHQLPGGLFTKLLKLKLKLSFCYKLSLN